MSKKRSLRNLIDAYLTTLDEKKAAQKKKSKRKEKRNELDLGSNAGDSLHVPGMVLSDVHAGLEEEEK